MVEMQKKSKLVEIEECENNAIDTYYNMCFLSIIVGNMLYYFKGTYNDSYLKNKFYKKIKNQLNNVIFELMYYIVNILINIVTRKILIYYIGIEVIALNHLLSNIVNVFTIIEFGICNIMLFNLYDAVSENNKKKIRDIMIQFRQKYFKISMLVIVIGVVFIPFLPFFLSDYVGTINYLIVYIFILFQISMTFLFSYKIYLLQAYQKNYLYLKVMIVYKLLSFIIEIVLLLLFHNYYIYFAFYTLNNIIVYYIISKYVDKK